MVTTNFNPVNDILLAIVFVGGIIVYSRSRIPQQTIKNLQDLTDAQGRTIAELKDSRLEDAKAIAELQGQIKVYKELPLRELADGIREVVKISADNAKSNQLILETLQGSAKVAERAQSDGGLLVKTKDENPLLVKEVKGE